LAIRGCKIYDDPTRPVDYACKYKIMRALEGGEEVELVEIPPPFIRLPGDPQLTSRQLIGGISIQRVREGYDLDHPEVFLPGRALKGNRGLIYIDELGAIPSVLQTLLHELFEEKQVTTTEGDIVPFKIDTIVIASTNPANYRGTNPIKEPLLDRMEKIQVNPPKSLEEEVEIGLRNMYVVKEKGQKPNMPYWHLEIGALAIRSLRRSAETGPSCRATIKLYDHLKSVAIRKGRQIPLLIDYGKSYGVAKLALLGRVEFPEESPRSVGERIEEIVEKSIDEICKQVYARIPSDKFGDFYEELRRVCEDRAVVDLELVSHLKKSSLVDSVVNNLLKEDKYGAVDEDLLKNEECYLACAEMLLESLARCLPACVEKRGNAYLLHELKTCAEERARPAREEDIVQFHGTESWPPVPA
jgi:magnesium chelatase subunit I